MVVPSIQVENDFLAVIVLKMAAPCHLGVGGILIMVPSQVSDFPIKRKMSWFLDN